MRSELKDAFRIADARWLSGGASKLQMAFTLHWNAPGEGSSATPLVQRMEPSEATTETSRLREFPLIKSMEGVVPVPPTYWMDPYGDYLPYPAIIYGFADGVTRPTAGGASGGSGVGTYIPPVLRATLGEQFVDMLAATRPFDWRSAELSAYDVATLGTQAVEWNLDHWERVWEEDANEGVPLIRAVLAGDPKQFERQVGGFCRWPDTCPTATAMGYAASIHS